MLAIVGTVPDLSVPILDAPVELVDNSLRVDDRIIAPDRGTPAFWGQRHRRVFIWAFLCLMLFSWVMKGWARGVEDCMPIWWMFCRNGS